MPLSQTRSDQRMNCKTFRFIYYDANEFCKLWPSSHVRNSWDQQQELCDECEQQGQARKLTFVLNLKCIFNHFQVPQRKCTRLFTTIILTEECIWEVTCFCFANWDVCNIGVKWSTKIQLFLDDLLSPQWRTVKWSFPINLFLRSCFAKKMSCMYCLKVAGY